MTAVRFLTDSKKQTSMHTRTHIQKTCAHFLTKGCTLNGSFASDRISSSSSFERKKKRGKASFLVSRKSLRPYVWDK